MFVVVYKRPKKSIKCVLLLDSIIWTIVLKSYHPQTTHSFNDKSTTGPNNSACLVKQEAEPVISSMSRETLTHKQTLETRSFSFAEVTLRVRADEVSSLLLLFHFRTDIGGFHFIQPAFVWTKGKK